MKTIMKNFGKTFVVLGSTILQLVALVLRFISLVFEGIGLVFRLTSVGLMNVSSMLLSKIGFIAEKRVQITEG